MGITLHKMKNTGHRVDAIMSTYWANIDPPRPNGLKRFQIGEQVVWALNEKNAIRKAKLYPDKSVIGD